MTTRPVVYVIGGAAPPIFDIEQLLQLLQERGWQPCLILTPTVANWIHASHFGELAGCPVRVEPRLPEEDDSGGSRNSSSGVWSKSAGRDQDVITTRLDVGKTSLYGDPRPGTS